GPVYGCLARLVHAAHEICLVLIFSFVFPRRPSSPLFPYTTLFRLFMPGKGGAPDGYWPRRSPPAPGGFSYWAGAEGLQPRPSSLEPRWSRLLFPVIA